MKRQTYSTMFYVCKTIRGLLLLNIYNAAKPLLLLIFIAVVDLKPRNRSIIMCGR